MGCVRSYSVATENKDEPSAAVQTLQAQQFDWALSKLDTSVKRTGRITKTLLLRIFHDISRRGCPSANQTLLLLRSCGSLLPEMFPEERTALAHRIWQHLQGMGVQFDISHYNALLKVYLQNEFKFSPTEFLAKMEAANVQPNRVTYQRLIEEYCQNGDIDGASTILGFMKSRDLPITEAVFNSLVTGHARAGDIESSKKIMSVMQETGIEPGSGTYVALLTAYAEKGDMDSVKKGLEEADTANCSLMDKDIMQIIYALAKTGHQQHIEDMVVYLKRDRGYVPDAINLCLRLITLGEEDSAFHVLKNFPINQLSKLITLSNNVGNFFLKHCVYMNTPIEKITSYCKELRELNLHSDPLVFTLQCALQYQKTGMSLELMKVIKEQNFPIRPHYFWPLLTQYLKDTHNRADGVLEIMKGMRELDVTPDARTLTTYIMPVFPSANALQQAYEDAGIPLQPDLSLHADVCRFAQNNLAQLYDLLSDPSFPPFELNKFHNELIKGFRKFDDVDLMVKITKLLDTDKRFSNVSATREGVGYFLYNLIKKMSSEELMVSQHKMKKFFNDLQAENIILPPNIFKEIDKQMESNTTSEPKGIEAMVQRLAELKAESKPIGPFLKDVINSLCAEENLHRALELKQQYEEFMTVGSYITLINQCCQHNDVEEALKLKMELSQKNSSFVLDTNKYINLVKMLCMNDRLDESVEILKEMKEKQVLLNDKHTSMLSNLFSELASRSSITAIQRLLDTIFTLGLVKPSGNFISHLITAYLKMKDLHGALDAVMMYHKLYNVIPHTHNLSVALVESGDTELLQKAMDFLSQDRGEMNIVYELCFAFLQTGRYREARQVIETPGLRAMHGRLQWFAEKCISSNQMEALEQMVDITSKLFDCNRNEMYSYILRLCKQTDNWQKAEAMWTKMQEENIVPSEGNLRMLAEILKANGQEVPFEFPESWFEKAAITNQVDSSNLSDLSESPEQEAFMSALNAKNKHKTNDAFVILKKITKKGIKVSSSSYDRLIRALLSDGALEDATAVITIAKQQVPNYEMTAKANSLLIITQIKKDQTKDALNTLKSMIQMNQVPLQFAVNRLVQSLGSQGDVAGIQEVESVVKDLGAMTNLSHMLFINNMALANIKNGDLDSAVEELESYYTSTGNRLHSMSYVFKKLFEDENEQAIDKLSALAERLANHFACYIPATDLFINLLDMEKFEDAKHMHARCKFLPEQKEELTSFLAEKARAPGQVAKVKALVSLIPDFTEPSVLNTYLMKCYVKDGDLESAKALYKQLQDQGVVMDELSLKRLAALYQDAGEPVPFTEPSKSFKFYAEKLKKIREEADK